MNLFRLAMLSSPLLMICTFLLGVRLEIWFSVYKNEGGWVKYSGK